MMTDDELRVGFMRRFNRVLTSDNLIALKKFMRNFEVDDYSDFDEMYEAIQLSVNSISDELFDIDDEDEAREILRRRYSKLL